MKRAAISVDYSIYKVMTSPYIRRTVKNISQFGGLRRHRNRQRGFSILEVLIVVTLLMIIGSIATLTMVTVVSNARLQGGATNLSGLLQSCRTLAVKQNRTMTTRYTVLGNGPVAYVKEASDSSGFATGDTMVQLGAPLVRVTSLSGPDMPTPLDNSILGFIPQTGDPSFNSRGMPCAYSGGTCTSAGFVAYFTDHRPWGKSGWMAVTITPAGRIRRWTWSGTAWTA